MRFSIKIIFITGIFAIIMIMGLNSCSNTGTQRSVQASTTMEKMQEDISNIIMQLDKTNNSLFELTKPYQTDLKKAYDDFKNNVNTIEGMEKGFEKHANEMKQKGKDYFVEWEKEDNKYKNQQIQELSEQRRAALEEIYGSIALNSIGVKDAFRAYISDLTEIQSYISNDLTAKGMEAIKPISQRVVNDGDDFKYSINRLETAIARAKSELYQNKK